MKQRKGLLIFGGIVAVLVLTCGIYLFAGTQRTESLMWNHLTERGLTAEDIQSLDVKHSFLNAILHGREWTVHVRYADEPDSITFTPLKVGGFRPPGLPEVPTRTI